MKYKTTFLPVLGFSFISCFAWGDDMTVLETIKVRAEASSEHDVQKTLPRPNFHTMY
jgi:iron complex outermembrane receptor protein